ncbi:hypothetical protein TraAM80_01726 [Trypanosoma rangeli]|uniref:Uncharacterized protein n=1 Tax=Trypanosoma rangeli TaxID=5698 RepID=A0A3S5IS74_TRYRA|nr:uncharacterized protein TraAM80_01726 [Trypanosoma rangeli]RNF10150.1 hypothetical protein TraAM80_01726 [Trypanosoma rangeli]|eukprot:RNF10150.1 hypothetical protein TraAM80_01726 [Trypanosoma rangeli]
MTALDWSPSSRSLTERPPGVASAPSSLPGSGGDRDGDGDGEGACARTSPNARGTPQRTTALLQATDNAAQKHFGSPSVAVVSLERHYFTTVQQLERIKSMYCRLDSHNDELENSFVVLSNRLDAFRSFLVLRLSTTAKELRREVRLLRDMVLFLLGEFAENMQRYEKRILSCVEQAGKGAGLSLLPLATFGRMPLSQTPQQSQQPSNAYVAAGNDFLRFSSSPHVHSGVRATNTSVVEGNPRVSQPREALVRSPHPSLAHSLNNRGDVAELWEALDEAVRKRENIEDKMLRQQESYEKHICSIRELYAQKERTLQRRIELLERVLKRDASGDGFRDHRPGRYEDGEADDPNAGDSEGESPHSSVVRCGNSIADTSNTVGRWPSTSSALRRGPRRVRPLSLERSSLTDADAPTEELHSKVGGGELGGCGTFSAVNGGPRRSRHSDDHQRRRFSALSAEAAAAAAREPWSMGRDVERRVRSQVLSCGRHTPYDGIYNKRFAPRLKREEKKLAAAASRLLGAVTGAHTAQNNPSQQRGARCGAEGGGALRENVVSRLYYLPRSPPRRPDTNTYLSPVPKSGVALRPDGLSDISTVARGLWAEKLLRERATRRPR